MGPVRFVQESTLLKFELAARQGLAQPPFQLATALHFRSGVDIGCLEATLAAIARRHPALRTAIVKTPCVNGDLRERQLTTFARLGLFVPGLYVQKVLPSVHVSLAHHQMHERATAAELGAVLREDIRTPFQFAQPPALRARLIRLGDASHVLVLVVSHIVADLIALGVLRREVAELYSTLRARAAYEPAAAASPVEFAAWEMQTVRRGGFDESIRYWTRVWHQYGGDQLRRTDCGSHIAAATEEPGPPSVAEVRLDPDDARRVRAWCAATTSTPFMFFRTCLAVAMYHLTGRPIVALGGNFANRLTAPLTRTVGWLNNRHLLPLSIEPRMVLSDLFRQARAATIEAMPHQAVPIQAVWNRMGQRYDYGADVAVATFDYHARQRSQLPDGITPFPLRDIVRPWLAIDLDVRVWDEDQQFVIVVAYASGYYPPRSMESLVSLIAAAARRLTSSPHLSVSSCRS